jgi:hypothetical protein
MQQLLDCRGYQAAGQASSVELDYGEVDVPPGLLRSGGGCA